MGRQLATPLAGDGSLLWTLCRAGQLPQYSLPRHTPHQEQPLAYRRQGLSDQAHLHYHQWHGHHLWPGTVVDTLYLAVQLCLYGDGHLAGVYLAAGGHLHLTDAPCGWRTHPQHLSQLLPHHLCRCSHHFLPHHLDPGCLCQHNAAAAHAHRHPMAGPYHQEIPTAGDAQ